eukprot:4999787-Amphidinium_carterae.1
MFSLRLNALSRYTCLYGAFATFHHKSHPATVRSEIRQMAEPDEKDKTTVGNQVDPGPIGFLSSSSDKTALHDSLGTTYFASTFAEELVYSRILVPGGAVNAAVT